MTDLSSSINRAALLLNHAQQDLASAKAALLAGDQPAWRAYMAAAAIHGAKARAALSGIETVVP